MGLLVIPKKAVVVEPPNGVLSPFGELIDLVGRLSEEAEPIVKQIAELQEQLKPLAKAKADLQSAIDAMELPSADSLGDAIGAIYKVEIGKKGSSRSIVNMPKVVELMGADLFLKVATVTLKNIDAYLTAPQREQVVEVTRTNRTYKLIRRPKK